MPNLPDIQTSVSQSFARYGRGEERERTPSPTFDSDYEVEIFEWLARAKGHVREMVVPFLGYLVCCVLVSLPTICIPCLGGVALVLFGPALASGPYVVAIQILRRRPWDINTFFAGFYQMANLTVLQFWVPLLALISCIPLALSGGLFPGDANIIFVGLVLSVFLFCYLFIRMFYFAPLIVIDRGADPFEAVTCNWSLTEGHFWTLFVGAFVLVILALSGALVFVVGLLVTIPFAVLAQTAGYLTISRQDAIPLPVFQRPNLETNHAVGDSIRKP